MADDPDSHAAEPILRTRDRLRQLRRLADSADAADGVELFERSARISTSCTAHPDSTGCWLPRTGRG
ncbi:hypothetical protein GCM10027613_50100 [Microlunatus endophyticus]